MKIYLGLFANRMIDKCSGHLELNIFILGEKNIQLRSEIVRRITDMYGNAINRLEDTVNQICKTQSVLQVRYKLF